MLPPRPSRRHGGRAVRRSRGVSRHCGWRSPAGRGPAFASCHGFQLRLEDAAAADPSTAEQAEQVLLAARTAFGACLHLDDAAGAGKTAIAVGMGGRVLEII